jgi:nitrite reductase/ring-hydroxylating ferredoxin subunit
MKTPTRLELENFSVDDLGALAGELAQEDERIKTVRAYFIDEIRRRIPDRPVAQGDLLESQMAAVVHNGKSFLVARVGDKVFALDNKCPHRGFPLHYRGRLDGHTITCSFHSGQFDIRTGACLRHPAETYPCASFRVVTAEDGTVVCEPKKENVV